MSNIVVTVCARAKSQGLPEKHLRLVAGQPLLFWTLAQAASFAREIVLFTDIPDAEVDKIVSAIPGGEAVIRVPRPPEIDDGPKMEAIRYAVGKFEERQGAPVAEVIDLDVCNPLRFPDDVDGALALFVERNKAGSCPCVWSGVKGPRHPAFNQFELVDGRVHPAMRRGPFARRQDTPDVVDCNNSIFIYRRDFLMEPGNNKAQVPRSCPSMMSPASRYDVDTEQDLFDVDNWFRRLDIAAAWGL